MKKQSINKLTILSLLSASPIILSGGATASISPLIAKAFPHISQTNIDLLATISSLSTIITILMGGLISNKIGAKKTVLSGMFIIFISTILFFLKPVYPVLLFSRLLFGVGIGLMNPLLLHYMSNLYTGDKRARMLSIQSSFEGLGGMSFSYLVGALSVYGWTKSFAAYFLIIPMFVLFLLFVPDIEISTEKAQISEKINFDSKLFLYIFLLALGVISYMTLSLKISQYFVETGIGGIKNASLVLMLIGVGSMSSGIVFKYTTLLFKEKTPSMMFLIMAAIMFLLPLTESVLIVYIFSFIYGFSFRTFVPFAYARIYEEISNAPIISRILLINFNISIVITPIINNKLMEVLNFTNVASLYTFFSFILIGLAITSLFIFKKKTS